MSTSGGVPPFGTSALPLTIGGGAADGFTNNAANAITVITETYDWDGGFWVRERTPNVFKTVDGITSLGQSAVWTPTSGKKFRLMKGYVGMTNRAAAAGAGDVAIDLREQTAGTVILRADFTVPAAAVNTAGQTVVPFDLGNGFLASAANNALTINLGTALTAGGFFVLACGTEE